MIILILIIIIIIIYFHKSRFVDLGLYNGDEWSSYRIGDVIFQPKNSEFYDPKFVNNILYHTDKFKGSIAAEYILNNESNEPNLKLLNQIIKKRVNNSPNQDTQTLYLHIRVGDVLCKKNSEWLNKINTSDQYTKKNDTKWWNGILKYIRKNNINKVVIISGLHLPECIKESNDYILDRKKFLENNNLNVTLILGQSPDDDIIRCAYVKHFITTGGGYGKLIDQINKMNN